MPLYDLSAARCCTSHCVLTKPTSLSTCAGLLGIPPAPNNGTRGALYNILTRSQASQLPPTQAYPPTTPTLSPSSIDRCPFPTNGSTFISRTSCDECVCSVPSHGVGCEGVSNTSVVSADRALDISDVTGKLSLCYLMGVNILCCLS